MRRIKKESERILKKHNAWGNSTSLDELQSAIQISAHGRRSVHAQACWPLHSTTVKRVKVNTVNREHVVAKRPHQEYKLHFDFQIFIFGT